VVIGIRDQDRDRDEKVMRVEERKREREREREERREMRAALSGGEKRVRDVFQHSALFGVVV
jgi:Fe-S cluster assembly ATPase SufC